MSWTFDRTFSKMTGENYSFDKQNFVNSILYNYRDTSIMSVNCFKRCSNSKDDYKLDSSCFKDCKDLAYRYLSNYDIKDVDRIVNFTEKHL